MRRPHGVRVVAVLAALSAAVAGCSTTGRADAPPLTAVPTPTALAGYPLPLVRYRLSPEESRTIDRAHGLLVGACMRRIGFADYAPSAITAPEPVEGPDEFGFLDAAAAATRGFHRRRPAADKTAPPGRRGASRAEIAALSGTAPPSDGTDPAGTPPGGSPTTAPSVLVPPGGCVGEAGRRLEPAPSGGPAPLVTRLATEADRRTVADPRVGAATREWADCMKRAGWTYRSPADMTTEQWATEPTPTEISIAVADVACTRQTNLPGIAMAVMTAIEEAQVREHRAELDAVRAELDARVAAARQLVDGGAG